MAYRYEKNSFGGQDIVIDGWEKGIAPSPHFGISDLRQCDVYSVPGTVIAGPSAYNESTGNSDYLTYSSTFTANSTTDVLTMTTSVPVSIMAVTFTSTGSLPTGISSGTKYYLVTVAGVTKISTTMANAVSATYLNFTSNGSGTLTASAVRMQAIMSSTTHWKTSTFTGFHTSSIFAVDSSGQVWAFSYADYNKWVLILGNSGSGSYFATGIAVYQDWLFVFGSDRIDVYGKLTGAISTHAWYNNWKALNGSVTYSAYRKTLVGQDNVLYWTDYQDDPSSTRLGFVGSLRTVSGQVLFADTGNPTTSSSTTNYTFNSQSLDFPAGEEPQALAELNSKLVIATGTYSIYTTNKENSAKIYTWDRVSPSFDFPVSVPTEKVYDIKNVNNLLYIFSGRNGIVYKTNMSSVAEAFSIPRQLYTEENGSNYQEGQPLDSYTGASNAGGYPYGGIVFGYQSVYNGEELFFSCNFISGTGIYAYDTEKGTLRYVCFSTYGTGSDISSDIVNIFSLIPFVYSASRIGMTGFFFAGVYYNGGYNYFLDSYDYSRSSTRDYESYVITDMIRIGVTNNLKTFQQLEYILDKKMNTGNGVSESGLKFYYRENIGDSWTLLATEDFATYGAISSRVIDFPAHDMRSIQIKVEINKFTRLREIRLR